MSYLISFFSSRIRSRLEVWGVRIIALLTAGMGLINLFSALTPALHNRLLLIEDTLPLEVCHGGQMTATLAGFALLLVAGALWRRKRTRWQLTIILLAISVITDFIKDLDFEEASLRLNPIASLGENPADHRVEHLLHRIAETIKRFYYFKGLISIKRNFIHSGNRVICISRGIQPALGVDHSCASPFR